MKCSDIMLYLEQLSPKKYALDWDNVGLLVGSKEQDVKKIMLALDASMEVIEQAVTEKVDLLITHHPMIFGSIKTVNMDTLVGKKIMTLLANNISCFAMHTNFDIMGSMADIAADRLQLSHREPLEVTWQDDHIVEGIGRVGKLPQQCSVQELAEEIKKQFSLPAVMVYGALEQRVERIAICPGSGKSVIADARQKEAQVLVTGDLGHHEGLDAKEDGLILIDATHYGLEHIFTEFVKQYLEDKLNGVTLVMCEEKAPYQLV